MGAQERVAVVAAWTGVLLLQERRSALPEVRPLPLPPISPLAIEAVFDPWRVRGGTS